ncbi:MAG: DUF86 domain-containing protein [Deltaproteobacteria bacterium]|nr:DUF86 domain-containing protein [Deltaproteobacteria bacterium]
MSVDRDLVLAKATSVRRHLNRVTEKRDVDLPTFLKDVDRQESILFNLQMAIQNCIDIAAYIIGEEGFGVAGSTNEMFYLLEENGFMDTELTEKMVSAVGFRNLIVHEYSKVELKEVFEVAHKDIKDLNEYLKSIFRRLGLVE